VPEKPHARLYAYFGGKLTTVPAGSEFPWADCVPGKDTFLK